MAVVAVAGGTGNLGRTLVEAILAAGDFTVVVLARKSDPEKEKELDTTIVAVDYTDVNDLVAKLDEHKVNTVISTIDTMMGGSEPELNLIKAADRSSSVKRFIPSVWDCKYSDREAEYFSAARSKMAAMAALESTNLEHTTVFNGFLLDYYVTPHVKSYMSSLSVVFDMANNTAAIPGSGNTPVVFTYSFDVARLVAAHLLAEKWEKETYIIGDKVTLNEFLKIAEEVKGVKFNVMNDSIEKLKRGEVSELPSHPDLYPYFPKEHLQGLVSAFGLLFDTGVFDLQPLHTLNEAYPHIKANTVRQLVDEAWRGK
ncbi:nmra-like family protein [Fusarium bulbicola]|nr:nmra-like family protein [Fusarium bulbicola]